MQSSLTVASGYFSRKSFSVRGQECLTKLSVSSTLGCHLSLQGFLVDFRPLLERSLASFTLLGLLARPGNKMEFRSAQLYLNSEAQKPTNQAEMAGQYPIQTP